MYVVFFFFKQKTAYEMRISDWSSDVCSSDLDVRRLFHIGVLGPDAMVAEMIAMVAPQDDDGVVGKPFAFERFQHLADLDIDVGNAGIIAVQQLALQFGRKLVAADVPRRLAIGVDLAALLVGIGGGAFGPLFGFGPRTLRRVDHLPITLWA